MAANGQAAGEITPEELKRRLDAGETVFILDVRNPPEYEICRISGSTLIPLPTLPRRLEELDRTRELVVHCKSGMRSQQAIGILCQAGFANLKNLKGGILAWADKIDPSMPKY
jgi:adenylyltransferase/sulfurtransferase